MDQIKNERGITLITLVIIIIVLLLLAGVTIATLIGENRILTRTSKAKTETEIANIKEQIQIEILEKQATNQTTEISRIELKAILDKYFREVPEDYTIETEITVKAEYGEYKMKVSDLYSGTLVEKQIITSQDIANAADKSKYYGAIVKKYELPSETTTDVGWKIFYADINNIYLIADNYIEIANLPNSTGKAEIPTSNKPSSGNNSYPRGAYFDPILGDYAGSARIIDSKLKALNNDYFNQNNFTSTNINMKAVAYMMDINAWNSKFKDINDKAEYAIGGPTIEMLIKSYNSRYEVDYQARAKNAIGYEISTDGGNTWKNDCSKYLHTDDSVYVISSTSEAYGMWVASPSANNSNGVIYVSHNGLVNYSYTNDGKGGYRGFRPVICLKSNIQLQRNEDGTYTIK